MSAEACPRTDGKILFLAILVSAITAVTSTNEPIKRSKPAPQKRSNKAFFILDASFETQHDVSTADHLESHDSVDVNIEFGRYHRVVKRKRLHPNIRKRVNKTSRSLTMEDEKDKQEKSLRRTTSSSQKHKKTNLDIDVELLESFLKYKAGQQKYTNQQSFEITGSQVEMQTKNINHGVDGELLESLLKSEKELSGISYAYTGIPTAYPTIKVSVKTTKNVSTPSPTTLSISSQPTSAAPTTSDSTITITPSRVSGATSMPSTGEIFIIFYLNFSSLLCICLLLSSRFVALISSVSLTESETSTSASSVGLLQQFGRPILTFSLCSQPNLASTVCKDIYVWL